MTEFQDTKGRTWRFNLTIGAALKLKENVGFDVMKLTDVKRLDDDSAFLLDVLAGLLQDQLIAAGVSVEQFTRAMDEDSTNAAVAAINNAVRLFLPKVKSADRKQPEVSNQNREWDWQPILELAAGAGVDPGRCTLRELLQRCAPTTDVA